jgi:integrator complex subunit 11
VKLDDAGPARRTLEKLYNLLNEKLTGWTVNFSESTSINIESVIVKIEGESNEPHKNVLVSWTNQDEDLGSYILGLLQNIG